MSILRNSTYYARETHATTQARNKYFKPQQTFLVSDGDDSSDLLVIRDDESSASGGREIHEALLSGFPFSKYYNKTMAQFCKYWTCVMFVIIAISSIH